MKNKTNDKVKVKQTTRKRRKTKDEWIAERRERVLKIEAERMNMLTKSNLNVLNCLPGYSSSTDSDDEFGTILCCIPRPNCNPGRAEKA